jgi:hypothetical protein
MINLCCGGIGAFVSALDLLAHFRNLDMWTTITTIVIFTKAVWFFFQGGKDDEVKGLLHG